MLFCFVLFTPPPPSLLSSCSIYSACEVIFFRGNPIGLKNWCHHAVSPSAPRPSPLQSVFNSSCHFCRVSFQWCTVFPSESERHGACPCPEMLGSSVMWWVYIFKKKITPIVWIMSIIVILNFAVDDDYIYIFFSSAVHCYENHSVFIVGFCFYEYAVCVLHVVLRHFRENKRSLSWWFKKRKYIYIICLIPTVLSKWYPLGLTYSLPVKVAVIESRHGTTHCLNTVDHSRGSQETHPVTKYGPRSRPLRKKLFRPRQA